MKKTATSANTHTPQNLNGIIDISLLTSLVEIGLSVFLVSDFVSYVLFFFSFGSNKRQIKFIYCYFEFPFCRESYLQLNNTLCRSESVFCFIFCCCFLNKFEFFVFRSFVFFVLVFFGFYLLREFNYFGSELFLFPVLSFVLRIYGMNDK